MRGEECHISLGGTARSPQDIELLHTLGLEFAEIPVTDPEEITRLIQAFKGLQDALGMRYLCHGPREGDPNDIESLEKNYFPRIRAIIKVMNYLKMSLLTLHLWLDQRFVNREAIHFKIGLLSRILELAASEQVTVCIENLSERASDLEPVFREMAMLGMTLDLGHAQLLSDVNTSYSFMEKYPERIKHVHMHDNWGGSSYHDDIHLPPGKGSVDFRRIFSGLRKIGYCRTVTLELKPAEIKGCLGFVKSVIY